MQAILASLYCVAFLFGFTVLAFWLRRRRGERLPFPENTKLLRGPGETARIQLKDWETNFVFRVILISLIPMVGGSVVITAAVKLNGWPSAIVGAAATAVTALLSWWFLRGAFRKLDEMLNRELGLFGERVVADTLEPLKYDGYRIYHDVPCDGRSGKFNIDHVIVGASGVYAIETKTRRKGRSRDGFAAHEIIYDGEVLAYPWGEDRFGLEQAGRQAEWLAEWLESVVGQRPLVQAILTFPGWMVITRKKGPIAVLNPKMIVSWLRGNTAAVLEAREVDLICRQLESRCRDVAF